MKCVQCNAKDKKLWNTNTGWKCGDCIDKNTITHTIKYFSIWIDKEMVYYTQLDQQVYVDSGIRPSFNPRCITINEI